MCSDPCKVYHATQEECEILSRIRAELTQEGKCDTDAYELVLPLRLLLLEEEDAALVATFMDHEKGERSF